MQNSTSASNLVLNPEDSQVSATSSAESEERLNYDDYPAEFFVDLRLEALGSYRKYYFNEARHVSPEDA